jgi:hypothetical protein
MIASMRRKANIDPEQILFRFVEKYTQNPALLPQGEL